MKSTFSIALLLVFILSGCSIDYVQLFKTKSVNIKSTNDVYIFENDTLKIEYSFWADKGVMAFSVYNKSDRPIYLDWRKSTYISNTFKANYWTDNSESHTTAETSGYAYFYHGPLLMPFVGSSSVTNATTITTKPERITFIPPRTHIYKSDFYLMMNSFGQWGKDYEKRIEPLTENSKKMTKVFVKKFTKENTPLDFRNFLTFSYKEDFSTEFYIDNEFYVEEVQSMDKRHLFKWVSNPDEPSEKREITQEKRGTDFYRKAY